MAPRTPHRYTRVALVPSIVWMGSSAVACGQTSSSGDGDSAASSSGGATLVDGPSIGGSQIGDGDGGSAAGGGTNSGGESGSGGGTGEPDGLETFAAPCDSIGALACSLDELKLRLICDADGTWGANGTCDGDTVCDPSLEGRGTCREPLPECVGEEPGHVYCEGTKNFECGERLVSSEEVGECTIGCLNGVCLPVADQCPSTPASSCASDCDGPDNCTTGALCSGITPRTSDWPPTNRIPSASDLCEAPDTECEWGSPTGIHLFADEDVFVKLLIPPDWSALIVDDLEVESQQANEYCDDEKLTGCQVFEGQYGGVVALFFPARPDAAARNVEIEFSETPIECP